MADRIYIEGLRIDCIIGFADWERLVRQTVRLDFWVECDVRAAARSDASLSVSGGTASPPETPLFNTKACSKRLQQLVAETSYNLIETLAETICQTVLDEFPVQRIGLRLSKPGALRGARNVAVRIVRTARDYPL